jgi:hypothetical protein
MSDLGVIKGRAIALNKDGDSKRLLLTVEVMEDDVRTVELVTQAGMDINPATGCRVNIVPLSESYQIGVGVSDDLLPECDPGEFEYYSTDDPATTKKARIKGDKNGNIIINQGANHATQWEALNTKLQALVTAINAALATKSNGSGSAGTLTLDLTSAEVTTVKVP